MTQPEPIVLQHRTMTCEGKLLGDDITLMQQKSQGDGGGNSALIHLQAYSDPSRVLGNAKSRNASHLIR